MSGYDSMKKVKSQVKIPSKQALKSLIKMSLDNAGQFLLDAKVLIDNSSFGHAYALTVLALEEIGKAIYYNWAILGFIKIDKNLAKNLKYHKHKQRVLMEILRLGIIDRGIKKHTTFKRRKYPFRNIFELRKFLENVEKSTEFRSVGDFYESLEQTKQLALYVDVREGKLTSPRFFDREMCEHLLQYVSKLFIISTKTLLKQSDKQGKSSEICGTLQGSKGDSSGISGKKETPKCRRYKSEYKLLIPHYFTSKLEKSFPLSNFGSGEL